MDSSQSSVATINPHKKYKSSQMKTNDTLFYTHISTLYRRPHQGKFQLTCTCHTKKVDKTTISHDCNSLSRKAIKSDTRGKIEKFKKKQMLKS